MPFDPGNDPREAKGCLQEEEQDTDSERAGTPSEHNKDTTDSYLAARALGFSPALPLMFPVTLGKSLLQSGTTEKGL